MADKPTVDLVTAVLTREAENARPVDSSPYSWGAVAAIMPNHARSRSTAFAVVDALRSAGRLATPVRLAEFGRAGWAVGWMVGAVVAGSAERHAWPWWAALAVGGVSFAVGILAVGLVARSAAGRDGGRRG